MQYADKTTNHMNDYCEMFYVSAGLWVLYCIASPRTVYGLECVDYVGIAAAHSTNQMFVTSIPFELYGMLNIFAISHLCYSLELASASIAGCLQRACGRKLVCDGYCR